MQALFVVGTSSPKDGAVVWRSGGGDGVALCTCFESAEDAATHAASGSACTCIYAHAFMLACLSSLPPFHARHGAPPFFKRVRRGPGSDAVVAWDGMVFTIVTVVGGKADLFLARGCRVSPHHCGHTQRARRHLLEEEGGQGSAAATDIVDDALQFADGDSGEDGEARDGQQEQDDNELLQSLLGGPVGGNNGQGGHEHGGHGVHALVDPKHPGPVLPPAAAAAVDLQQLTEPVKRNFVPCSAELTASQKWTHTAELHTRKNRGRLYDSMLIAAVGRGDAFDLDNVLYEAACPCCNRAAPTDPNAIYVDDALLTISSRTGGMLPVKVGSWVCNACNKMVLFDGACGVFVLPELDNLKRLALFTREVCDDLLSFVVNYRSSFSSATRHWARTLPNMTYRRQTIITLGLTYLGLLDVPAKLFLCSLCGPSPEVVIMDGQALVFQIPQYWRIKRSHLNVPVLPIPLTGMSGFKNASQANLVQRITRNATTLSNKETATGAKLMEDVSVGTSSAEEEAAVVLMSFFFPMDAASGDLLRRRPSPDHTHLVPSGRLLSPAQLAELAGHLAAHGNSEGDGNGDENDDGDDYLLVDDDDVGGGDSSGEAHLEDAPSSDDDENPLAGAAVGTAAAVAAAAAEEEQPDVPPTAPLGGTAPKRTPKNSKSFDQRTGLFAPRGDIVPLCDVPVWTTVRWFLRALLGELVVGIFASCVVETVMKLVAALRSTTEPDKWRTMLKGVADVAFVSNILSLVGNVGLMTLVN